MNISAATVGLETRTHTRFPKGSGSGEGCSIPGDYDISRWEAGNKAKWLSWDFFHS